MMQKHGSSVVMTRDPKQCVSGAHVVVTDTWVSMGQEEEYEKRVKEFDGYQVRAATLSLIDYILSTLDRCCVVVMVVVVVVVVIVVVIDVAVVVPSCGL